MSHDNLDSEEGNVPKGIEKLTLEFSDEKMFWCLYLLNVRICKKGHIQPVFMMMKSVCRSKFQIFGGEGDQIRFLDEYLFRSLSFDVDK